MFKLPDELLRKRDELISAAYESDCELADAIYNYNLSREALERAEQKYNATMKEGQQLCEAAKEAIESFILGKSPEWQDSHLAEKFRDWSRSFEELDLECYETGVVELGS